MNSQPQTTKLAAGPGRVQPSPDRLLQAINEKLDRLATHKSRLYDCILRVGYTDSEADAPPRGETPTELPPSVLGSLQHILNRVAILDNDFRHDLDRLDSSLIAIL